MMRGVRNSFLFNRVESAVKAVQFADIKKFSSRKVTEIIGNIQRKMFFKFNADFIQRICYKLGAGETVFAVVFNVKVKREYPDYIIRINVAIIDKMAYYRVIFLFLPFGNGYFVYFTRNVIE